MGVVFLLPTIFILQLRHGHTRSVWKLGKEWSRPLLSTLRRLFASSCCHLSTQYNAHIDEHCHQSNVGNQEYRNRRDRTSSVTVVQGQQTTVSRLHTRQDFTIRVTSAIATSRTPIRKHRRTCRLLLGRLLWRTKNQFQHVRRSPAQVCHLDKVSFRNYRVVTV